MRNSTRRADLAFLSDQAGGVLPIAAVSILLLTAIVGGGVDASRAYRVKNRLQYACDAAVLAGRKSIKTSGFDARAQAVAKDLFDGNFNDELEGTTSTRFVTSTPDLGNTINGTAQTELPTLLMHIFGFAEVGLSTTCSASMSVGNSDVMMVLDTTGSMAGSRIDGLRAAMKSFYATVAGATSGSNARVRFGFVPYSSTVNVGHLLKEQDMVSQMTIQSRYPETKNVPREEFDHWDTPTNATTSGYSNVAYSDWAAYSGTAYKKSKDCKDDLPGDTAWTNNGSSSMETDTRVNSKGQKVETTTTTQPQKMTEYTCSKIQGKYYIISRDYTRDSYRYDTATSEPVTKTVIETVFDHFIYKPVTYNVAGFVGGSALVAPIGEEGANVSSFWNGCIQERESVNASSFSYSKVLGMDPSGAYDLDLDTPADPGNPATQWRPMWPEGAYFRTKWVSTRNGGYYAMANVPESLSGMRASSYCPQRARLLAEMTKTEFDNYADSLVPVGSTYHDIGMIWGGRLSSTTGPYADNVALGPQNGGAVARHLVFMTDGEMAPDYNIQSAYGIEYHDRRVTADGVSSQASRHTSRFRAVCDAVKAKGIRIWVIAFGTSLTSDLEECASAQSAFAAADADELNEAFQEIAKNVGELRITQ